MKPPVYRVQDNHLRIVIQRHQAKPRYMTPMSEADRQQNLDDYLRSLDGDP